MFSLIQSVQTGSELYMALSLLSKGNLPPKFLRPDGEADQSFHLAGNKE